MNYDNYGDFDSLYDSVGLSVRAVNALGRAGITTVSALKAATDYQLSRIRNFGNKCIAEINAAYPDRIRVIEGEAEQNIRQGTKNKAERAARHVMQYMENESLSQLMERGFRFSGNKRARRVLAEYCFHFPERIDGVIDLLEANNDTADKLYKQLKITQTTRRAATYGSIQSREEQELYGDVEPSPERQEPHA